MGQIDPNTRYGLAIPETGSPAFKLSKDDLKKVAIGAGMAAAGAVLTYLTTFVTGHDFGTYTPIITMIWAIIANTARKFITNTQTL